MRVFDAETYEEHAEGTMRHSRNWYRVMETIRYSGLAVISAMFGAVIGTGTKI
ncbi:hypothetical protein [Mangrovicoccus ximenensis]|uniref:hypothetical protein n=1 Tax=Mangrovicoccus ximenensis TaxID=1911570 RepID=UPI00191BEEEE|nr:hypothetical protein [Mangrovicoccus ximenensis]